ncbi:TPA: TIGR04222 domain-containing membrane protein [Burkholderia ambifaria]
MAAIPSLPSAGDARALTDAQQALLTRLLTYSPDDPHAAQPYSRRLAEAEGWTHAHALAVIDEYKRFAFLAQAAGHPVTPSVAVDAAWHFHLQYTLEYWDVFCARVLRAPLHHMPGTGAPDEAAVYARRYQDTLDSYRRLFGCEPPASIWPRPEPRPTDAGAPHTNATNAAPSTNRPTEPPSAAIPAGRRIWRDRLPKAIVPAAAASVIATAASARDFDVLNYTGPQFLAFYLPVCIVALLLIVVLQQIEYRCRRRRAQAFSSGLTPEEAAYLMGDESRAVQVATLSLVQAGAIDLSMGGRLGARAASIRRGVVHMQTSAIGSPRDRRARPASARSVSGLRGACPITRTRCAGVGAGGCGKRARCGPPEWLRARSRWPCSARARRNSRSG